MELIMSIKFSSFAIRGIDVSEFNGNIDWSKVANTHFTSIRVGFGRVLDAKFKVNWAAAKGKVKRFPYWYMDYYSNHKATSSANGISDAEWGKIQAETCWNAIKNDPEGVVFLDIENCNPATGPAITTVSSRAQAIAKAFLQRMDQLNGKRNGIYCSLGMLTWFNTWFKDRPLWLAWYNETQTMESVLKAVKAAVWTGTLVIWQYASHGDLNGDGVADGVAMGMQYKFLDLNAMYPDGWLVIWGEVEDAPVIVDPPVVEPEEPETGEYEKYRVLVPVLNLRSHPVVSSSTVIGKLFVGNELRISQVDVLDGKAWGQLHGQGWWCCLQESGVAYAVKV